MEMKIFELSQVSRIVDMDQERVRNWSIGRPLNITPSVRTGGGAGRSNLYAIEDIYRMALAKDLHAAGMSTDRIADVLRLLPEKFAEREWLRIWLQGEKLRIKTDRDDPPQGVLVWQTVRLSELISRVDARVASS